MTSYLADTNAFSRFLRNKDTDLTRRMTEAVGAGQLRLSVMVLAELEFGAQKAFRLHGTTRYMESLRALRSILTPDPIGPEFTAVYASVRDFLEAGGMKIGDRDTIIAAHALSLNATLVTANVEEFARIPNLVVENWESSISKS